MIKAVLKTPTPSELLDTYWKFAFERQEIFWRRQLQSDPPWTNDPILQSFRFTNVYRFSDRVSQFLISKVIYTDEVFSSRDMLLRILIFRLFNKIETWASLEEKFGKICFASFSPSRFKIHLDSLQREGRTIFSSAYIMPSRGPGLQSSSKHENLLNLIKLATMTDIADTIISSKSLEDLYRNLISLPMVGKFLAIQLAIDINYSEIVDFSEMDFIVAGPGAEDGIHKCFKDLGDFSYADVIKSVTESQEEAFSRLGLEFRYINNRRLQLIDCQNVFCEISKYSRALAPHVVGNNGRTRIKRRFEADTKTLEGIFLPPKWNKER